MFPRDGRRESSGGFKKGLREKRTSESAYGVTRRARGATVSKDTH